MPNTTESPAADRRRRRGPTPQPPELLRAHCVSVRLSPAELAQLDARRGRLQRGEWLRCAALDMLPPMVPPINAQAWAELSRAASNLNQIARGLNVGDQVDARAVAADLAAFRAALFGAQL